MSIPEGYAKQFNVPEDTNLIPEVRSRIVRVRMEEEECAGLEIAGAGDCGNFAPGHRFTLKGHFNGDGDYLLTSVEHDAAQSGYRSGEQDSFRYENRFRGMPAGLRYRPRRVTAKPSNRRLRDRDGDRPVRRGDFLRPVRPHQGAVSLGPRGEVGRQQLMLAAGGAALGGQRLGRVLLAAHRS